MSDYWNYSFSDNVFPEKDGVLECFLLVSSIECGASGLVLLVMEKHIPRGRVCFSISSDSVWML